MHGPSVKYLRRILIGVIIFTLVSLLFNYLQTWYRRSRQITRAPQILAPEMKRSAKDVEYSEYRGVPRALRFKIHAKLLLETQPGKNLLEGIEAFDFNPDGSVRNLIRSRRAEYDPERKLADFFGEVRLFIGGKIELQTESLHYDLNSGIGTSPDSLRFQSEQFRGTAQGLRFDQKQQSLALDRNVDLTLEQRPEPKPGGTAPGRKLHATAERAFCSEVTNLILLEGKARIDSDSQSLSGERIEAVFDPVGKRIHSLTASGNAVYDSKSPEDARTLGGDRLVFGIGHSGSLEKITLSGQASFSLKSSSDEQDLRGSEIDVDFDPAELPTRIRARTEVSFRMKREKQRILISGHQLDAGFAAGTKWLESVLVRGNPAAQAPAKMSVEAEKSEGSELQADEIRMSLHESGGRSMVETLRAEGSAHYVSRPAGSNGESAPGRSMRASLLEMTQSGTGDFIESGSATGNVVISEELNNSSGSPQIKRLSADHARFRFFPGGNALKHLDAEGRVQIAYEKPIAGKSASPERFRTASDNMSAAFDLQSGRSTIGSAAQWGNFTYNDGARSATSGRCDYDAGKAVLVLTQSPKISDEAKSTTGDRMEYDQNRKVLSVFGRVRSDFRGINGKGSFLGSASSSSPGMVKADEMRYWTETGRVRYSRSVHALSENQDLTTDVLELTDGLDRVDARGSVRHLLSRKAPANSAGKDKSRRPQTAIDSLTTVRSSSMTYSKAKNQISYSGMVTLHSREMDLSSDSLDAVPDPEGKSIQQATARGSVVIHMGERVCRGDIARYHADSSKIVVTGNPAEVFDPARGRSSARRLTSSTADDTILLEK